VQSPTSTSDGGATLPKDPDNLSEASIGAINRVINATAAGILSSTFIVPTVVQVAASADRTRNVPEKSTSLARIPPDRNISPKASSL